MKVRGVIKIPKLPFTTGRRTFDGRSSNEGALMKINAERKLFDLPPRTVNLLIENRTFLENRVNRTSINRFALLIKIPFTGVGYAVTSYADRWRDTKGGRTTAPSPLFSSTSIVVSNRIWRWKKQLKRMGYPRTRVQSQRDNRDGYEGKGSSSRLFFRIYLFFA